jgi:hypothetical protein
MSWKMPEREEAQHVVWETMHVLREQLNSALFCNIKKGDLEVLTKIVMDRLDQRYYGKKKKRSRGSL